MVLKLSANLDLGFGILFNVINYKTKALKSRPQTSFSYFRLLNHRMLRIIED